MERESFEDEEVAEALNDTLISIKVEREERPDIDATCMKVCQMMTWSGGWPLTIIMTQTSAHSSPAPTSLSRPDTGELECSNSSHR